ncbi:hypothetical protein ISU07_20740 [Nocardioides islandensis]|uniref:Uncharacterized protein n=1 Tax=Nocardioides islandensis TaxID=433663 RepID=A0A930VDN5_9ACTN|nr:hypothetical protein [Nocardioides islandensis]MBF4765564.1 hypothetical protein [Nocardioides islandensis]
MLTDRVPAGEMDLGELPRRWKVLEDLYRGTRQALQDRDARILHDRMIDEAQTSGRRTYFGAQRCLDIAWDNHDALRSLLHHHGATQFAPWNLLRPTFEAAFYAIWLLDPDESLERRRRGLLLEWLDELEHRTYYADLKSIERFVDPEDHARLEADRAQHRAVIEDHDRTYSREAEELGMNWPLPRKVNVLDELGKLRHCDLRDGSDLILRSTWRTLSGMQHGRGSTMLRGSDRLDESPIEGGVHALLAVNDEAFVGAATITNGLHQQAVMLFRDRSVPNRSRG